MRKLEAQRGLVQYEKGPIEKQPEQRGASLAEKVQELKQIAGTKGVYFSRNSFDRMGLLAFCLDPNNRPTDSLNWFQKSFELEAEGSSQIATGPRIDWFALQLQAMDSKA